MQSKPSDPGSDRSQSFLDKAQNALQLHDFKLAIDFFEKAISSNPSSPLPYHKCAEACYFLKEYKQAQEMNNKSLQLNQMASNDNRPGLDSNNLISAHWLALKLDEILSSASRLFDTMEELKKVLDRNPTGRKDEINRDINRISQMYQSKTSSRSKILDIRKNEAKTVFDLLEIANENHLLSEEGLPCNLISARWFNKWKKYSFFHMLSGEKMEQIDGTEIEDALDFGEETSGGEATPTISKYSKNFPGPMEVSDLLEEEGILTDPDKVKSYSNYVVKQGLEENKDFVIVPHTVFKFLHKIYGGQELKRHVVFINDESNLTHVEIWLKKINIIQVPGFSKKNELAQQRIHTSRKETIKELKEKLFRIFADKIDPKLRDIRNCKVWKLDARYSIAMIQDLCEKNAKVELVNCKKLEDKISLEDCELSENDMVLVEYRLGADWIFTSEKEIKQNEAFQCACCHAYRKNLQYCVCMQVKYCNMECLKKHRPMHKNFCKTKEQTDSFISTGRNPNISIKFNKQQNRGLTGLQNLGNTCFMNSSLQCLSNTYELTYYFLSDAYQPDVNKKNPLGSKGYLANAFADLVKALWLGSENYVSPWALKKMIGRLAPQFSGYNQQDSQELLSYLLDGLHEDLNRIKKKPIVQSLDYKNQPDEEFSSMCWTNYMKRNHSIIVDLFAGQYKSKVTCPNCKLISITFDPFLYISLPIPHVVNINFQFYFVYRDPAVSPQKVRLNLPSNETAASLIRRIAEITKIKEEYLLIALIKEHKIIEYPSDNNDVKYLDKHDGIAFIFEVLNENFDGPLHQQDKTLHVEINVNQKSKKEKYYDNSVSFTRILKLPHKSTLIDLHFKIFKYFRHFLKNFYGNLDPEMQKDYPIQLENKEDDQIQAEFDQFFLQPNKNLCPPYDLTLLSENNQKLSLEYNTKNLISLSETSQTERELFFEVNLNFASFMKIEALRLNKCQEASFDASTPTDTKFCNLQNCLDQFIKEEVLDQNNAWYCGNCKKHQQATKKIEIYKAPDLLILHLKRFKNSSGGFYMSSGASKITKFVDFPIEGLNLNSYILGKKDQNMIYDLFAVSNHYGGLSGGHYTAYCQNFFEKTWFEFNDSSVGEVGKNRIVSDAAYVLFYRRRREITEENLSHSFRENRKME